VKDIQSRLLTIAAKPFGAWNPILAARPWWEMALTKKYLSAQVSKKADAFVAVTNGDNRNIMASQIAKEIFNVKKVVCRIYDPIRESTYNELGLETICPTVIGAQMLFDALSSDTQKEKAEKG